MSILQSLVIKLGMLAMTMGVVLWIGWQVPQTMQRPAVTHAVALPSEPPLLPADPAVDVMNPQAGAGEGRRSPAKPQPVDLNRATAADLDHLPGVGPVLAKRMVEYRKSIGRFHAVEDLRAVKGIGKKKFERLKPFVTVAAAPVQDEGKKGPI